MRIVYSLGSNLGDRLAHLREGIAGLATDTVRLVAVSSVYETAPWGVVGHPDYLNVIAVYEGEGAVAPGELLRRGLSLEEAAGRQRDGSVAPRPLDVDLIAVGELSIDSDSLTLPHPRAHLRGFVMVPWAEADPDADLVGHGRVADLATTLGAEGLTKRPDLTVAT